MFFKAFSPKSLSQIPARCFKHLVVSQESHYYVELVQDRFVILSVSPHCLLLSLSVFKICHEFVAGGHRGMAGTLDKFQRTFLMMLPVRKSVDWWIDVTPA